MHIRELKTSIAEHISFLDRYLKSLLLQIHFLTLTLFKKSSFFLDYHNFAFVRLSRLTTHTPILYYYTNLNVTTGDDGITSMVSLFTHNLFTY